MTTSPFAITLAAALAALPLASAATALAPLALDPAAGATAHYHLTFDGHLWNGKHEVYDHQISLTRSSDTSVHAVVEKIESGERADFVAVRAGSGVLNSPNPAEQFTAYNTIAALTGSAPATLTKGAAWDTHIVVDLGTSTSVDVPIHAWVASVAGDTLVVQGTGTVSTSYKYEGFDVPIDLTIRLASDFDGGTFARAVSSATEVVHAGPQTQTLDWSWSLERT